MKSCPRIPCLLFGLSPLRLTRNRRRSTVGSHGSIASRKNAELIFRSLGPKNSPAWRLWGSPTSCSMTPPPLRSTTTAWASVEFNGFLQYTMWHLRWLGRLILLASRPTATSSCICCHSATTLLLVFVHRGSWKLNRLTVNYGNRSSPSCPTKAGS